MSKRSCGALLASSILACLFTSGAGAQVSTEDPASVLVFPKIIADGNRDTFVQISNTSNSLVRATCFYVNAQLLFPNLPPGPFNEPLWQETEFEIELTAQQPTNWMASQGRLPDPLDPNCTRGATDCYGAGFDPGLVPALPEDFIGELICVEVDATGDPISGNHLSGEATLKDLSSGDVSKYGALGFAGFETNDGDGELALGLEYAACPQRWILDHTSDGSEVAAVGAGSAFHTDVTVVPCSQDFANQVAGNVTLQLQVTNELEQTFSTSTSVECWADLTLGDVSLVFQSSVLGTPTAQTRVRPAANDGGVLLVVEEFRDSGGVGALVASSAGGSYAEGVHAIPDLIRVR
jgi:hypothetical protein